jgi:hypothetical protein
MRGAITFLTLNLIVFRPIMPVSAQTPSTAVAVTSPQAGQVLQGVVTVSGTSAIDGFVSAEISFIYSGEPAGSWFLIIISSQPVAEGTLAVWDTTVISDGNYTLRLLVTLFDGTTLETLVPDLRVRNYAPPETSTPTLPPTATPTLIPTFTPILPTSTATTVPTGTPLPTPTAMPENPAILPAADIRKSILYGGTTTVVFFLFLILYLRLRRK